MTRSKWDQRIRRAEELAGAYPFAAEVLRLYQQIARFQKGLYLYVEAGAGGFDRLPAKFPEFLAAIERSAPEPVAAGARELAAKAVDAHAELLYTVWQVAPDFEPAPGRTAEMLAWIFLQPYAEFVADHRDPPPVDETQAICPACSASPAVGMLRQEGDGGKRSLLCGWCATEWTFGRIVCAACGEADVSKLAVYTAEQFPYVRVEACDTCRNYIKTVDLTKNGRAVPVVDELATIPLNLWAAERGYVKLRANLMGL